MRATQSYGLLACVLLLGCGSSSLPQVRAVAEGGKAIGEDVIAFGVVTSVDEHHLARTTAQNRALRDVIAMTQLESTKFSMRVGYGYSTLQASTEGSSSMFKASFQPLEDGWLAIVSARRPPTVAAQMRSLPSKVGSAKAEWGGLQSAFQAARSRALRDVIEDFVGDTCATPCEVTGTLTLIAMEVQMPGGGAVEVKVRAHANIKDTAELESEARQEFQKKVLNEYSRGKDIIEAAEAAVDSKPQSPMSYALLGSAAMKRSKFGKAVESFDKAFELAPQDIEFALALSRAHDLNGNLEKSATALFAAAKLAPDDAELARKYEGLRSNLAMDGIEVPELVPPEGTDAPSTSGEDPVAAPSGEETVIDLRAVGRGSPRVEREPNPEPEAGSPPPPTKRKGKKKRKRRRRKR